MVSPAAIIYVHSCSEWMVWPIEVWLFVLELEQKGIKGLPFSQICRTHFTEHHSAAISFLFIPICPRTYIMELSLFFVSIRKPITQFHGNFETNSHDSYALMHALLSERMNIFLFICACLMQNCAFSNSLYSW